MNTNKNVKGEIGDGIRVPPRDLMSGFLSKVLLIGQKFCQPCLPFILLRLQALQPGLGIPLCSLNARPEIGHLGLLNGRVTEDMRNHNIRSEQIQIWRARREYIPIPPICTAVLVLSKPLAVVDQVHFPLAIPILPEALAVFPQALQ